MFVGKVAAVYNLMPEGIEVLMDDLARRVSEVIPDGVRIVKSQSKPFAYGLMVLEVTFLMNDVAGITDSLEAALQTVEGVQTVEPISVSLI
jgi:translation elongation factor aEF-1 beta